MSEVTTNTQDNAFSSVALAPDFKSVTNKPEDRYSLELQRQALIQEVGTSATDQQLLSITQNIKNHNALKLNSPAYVYIQSQLTKVPVEERKVILDYISHECEVNINSFYKNQELYACAFSLLHQQPVPDFPESMETVQRRIANGETLQDIIYKSLQKIQKHELRSAKKRELAQVEDQLQQFEQDIEETPDVGLIQTNEYLNNHTIQGQVKDGFKDGGKNTSFDAQGKPINPMREIILVDRTKDVELQKLIASAQGIKAQYGSGYRAVFEVAKLVHQRMDSPTALKDADLLAQSPGEEVLIGDLKSGVCRHRALLFQIIASEIGIDTTQIRGSMNTVGQTDEESHAWNEVVINGQKYVVDVTNPPVHNFNQLDYVGFMSKQGFPKPGDKRLGWQYTDFQGTHSYTVKMDASTVTNQLTNPMTS